MATPIVKYNWANLDRPTLARYVLDISSQVIKQDLEIDVFHKKLTAHLKKLLPLKFKKNRNFKVKTNEVWVGGAYYSDLDQDREKCIELVLEYPLFENTINLTARKFQRIAVGIADTILHEIMHMRQYRRRKFKVLPDYNSSASKLNIRLEQSYLGCSDEIDAYAFNIACELVDKFNGDSDKIIEYLNENQQQRKRRHNSWRMYLKAFQYDQNHPIIQRLKKKVVRYLPQAYIGKPYRNKDWIDR